MNLVPEPDLPGVEEPITGALGRSEAEIQELWAASDQTWRDSLEIIRSLRCPVPIAPERLFVLEALSGEILHLVEYVCRHSSSATPRPRVCAVKSRSEREGCRCGRSLFPVG